LGVDLAKFKKRKGGELYGPCCIPPHEPKSNTTSFSYSPDGKFHCFSCEAKGRGAIDLVRAVRHCGFQEAVSFLEGIKASPTPQTPATDDSGGAGEAITGELKPLKSTYHKFAVPCEWLDNRVPRDIQQRFGVFAYNNPQRKSAYSGRVMIPITKDGELYGYLARAVEGEPKYLFPKGLPKHLFVFGADQITEAVKVLYLVESPFTVMTFASFGLPALSPYGWSVSDEQLEIICGLCKGVVYLPDANKFEQGMAVGWKLSGRLWVKYPKLPDGISDPEAMTKEQVLAL
jgi:DNA primase